MPGDLLAATKGEQCAFAIAVPLSEDAFIKDAAPESDHDFANLITGGSDPETAWREIGQALASKIQEVAGIAEQCHVKVVRQAVLSDFRSIFTESINVVTIFAHWRGSSLIARDIKAEPEVIIERIAEAAGTKASRETIDAILSRIEPLMPNVLSHDDPLDRRAFFAQMLNNSIIRVSEPLPGIITTAPGQSSMVGDLWIRTWHRNLIDLCAEETIRPGNGMELRNGIHTPDKVAGCIPSAWSGHIDLTMCHSAVLGHYLKNGRADRRIIMRLRPVEAMISLTILMRLYQDLETGSYNYSQRLSFLFQETLNIIEGDLRKKTSVLQWLRNVLK